MGGVGVTRLGRMGALSAPAHNKIASASARCVFHVDAANTASYPGSGTTWYDLSHNANAGTMYSGMSWNSSGWMNLDGVDDSAVFGVPSDLPTGSNPQTLMAVFRTTNVTPAQDVGGIGDNTADGGRAALFVSGGYLGVECRNTGFQTNSWAGTANTWVCFAAVLTGTNCWDWQLYVNGAPVTGSGIGTNMARVFATNNLNVGKIPGANASFFGGDIPIFKIWKARLTAGQVDHEFQIIRSRFGL